MSKPVICIDANIFLDLYRLPSEATRILKALIEQSEFIFITKHVVEEVNRNKLSEAERFLNAALERNSKTGNPALPTHLMDIPKEKYEKLKALKEAIHSTESEVADLAMEALQRVGKSEDAEFHLQVHQLKVG
jgi:predicted nucleic acid-binding protein